MASQFQIKVLFQTDYTSTSALMQAYRNEDYVAHYHQIHPARPLSARWPFALIGRLWRDGAERRHLRLSLDRLGSLSGHLLADIGAGSFAAFADADEHMADRLTQIQTNEDEAADAMAALAQSKKPRFQPVPGGLLPEVAARPVVRPRVTGRKNRDFADGAIGRFAV